MIDLIGDVHGHADELEELLKKLGYIKEINHYAHPDPKRKVLFVGDYIDRGPKIRETLEIVKQMVDHGSAIALMGNHEYNALCFHALNPNRGHLRKHSIKNILQHYETLYQFRNTKEFPNREKKYAEYLEWFKTLPLFYETESFRAVHACWDYNSIAYLKKHLEKNRLSDDLIYESEFEKGDLYEAIESTLKGKELALPDGEKFYDKDGHERNEMRYKWWEDLSKNLTYDQVKLHPIDGLPESIIDFADIKHKDYYKKDDKPVFFGHYWLKVEDEVNNKPSLFRNNICCLDYSVAKEGHLVAYSFNEESVLGGEKFTYVNYHENKNLKVKTT